MKATEANLLEFIKKSPRFIIPIYQRTYSWTERECRQLWDDILRAGASPGIKAHFMGSVVYIQDGLYQVTTNSPLLVIDGQQRLTTITLLIAALADALEKQPEDAREPIDGFSPRKLRNYYLVNPEEEGERHYKLLLSQTDRETLIALVDRRELPAEASLRVSENISLFRDWIASASDLKIVCQGVAKLLVIDTSLTRGEDNPQLIFESMNSTGKELSQADLVRNFVLMGLEPTLQTRLYKEYWRPFELEFGQQAYGEEFDAFMRHYLTLKTGEIPRQDQVYEAFKTHARSRAIAEAGTEALLKDIRAFAGYYCAMALGKEKRPRLREAFHDLRELKVEVAYPFLLEVYNDCAQGRIPDDGLLEIVRFIEAYVFRRAVCAIPTNSLNKTFATFGKALKKDRYLESVRAQFLLLPSYRRFPRDDEFRRDFETRDLYKSRIRSYWLRRLENHERKERVVLDEYTIEHIMPQNDNLSSAWMADLGAEWQRVHETWLHTLGNLTLTGYNSEYSDRPFTEKRDMTGGFKESPLRVNQGLGMLERWGEEQIRKRAERLSGEAVDVWRFPTLAEEALAAYRKPGAAKSTYTINDHPQLLSDKSRPIFEAFRREVLALDPCVAEEYLKLYVAYKAETNFVDVIPQKNALLLSLNIKWPDLSDPKGACRDVTGMGRWGNGDVEVKLKSLDDLPYIIGLVRQSLELQLGNGADA
ncbi:MAG: GmrSD restriction endonuclease domain-containing protein [Hyphomicrobiaceae bacterium]